MIPNNDGVNAIISVILSMLAAIPLALFTDLPQEAFFILGFVLGPVFFVLVCNARDEF